MGNTKTSTALRRVSSTLSKVSTPPSVTRPSKSSKQSKIVCLKLSSSALLRFPHEKGTRKSTQTKPPPPSIPIPTVPNEKVKPVGVKSEPKTPPAPIRTEVPSPPTDNTNQKPAIGPKTGTKRELGEGVDDSGKSKARPGPKKRQKMEPGITDGNPTSKPASGVAPAPTHKLGPKANQGAINAGLRALDRTGTPCRKWNKTGFSVKTFTGVTWQIPLWRAPRSKKIEADAQTGQPSLPTSNSQSKENNSSSNVGSVNETPNMASSPIPAVAIPA